MTWNGTAAFLFHEFLWRQNYSIALPDLQSCALAFADRICLLGACNFLPRVRGFASSYVRHSVYAYFPARYVFASTSSGLSVSA